MLTNQPAYRKAWEDGAKAYQEADSWEALAEGMRRKRTMQFVSVTMEMVGHIPCSECGIRIRNEYFINPDTEAVQAVRDSGRVIVHYYPKSKKFAVAHYYCGWTAVLKKVWELADQL